MKKTITILLTVFILLTLLTSCSQLIGDALEEPDEPSPPVETPEGGDKPDPTEPEPTEPEVTGVDEYGFTIWPEGNYLADKKFDTDEYLPDYDADPNFVQYVATKKFAVTSTDDTIYTFPYFFEDHSGFPLLFTDKATKISMPLCGKPECTHDNSDCNAYIPAQEIKGLRVYDGKLWWSHDSFKEGLVLNRMNLDGTDRETVMKLNLELDKLSGNATWALHRGYLYVGGQDDVVTDGKAGCSFTVYAQPIEGGDDMTILKREIVSCFNPWLCMKPVGNDLYIMLQYEDIGSEDIDGIHYELFRWDSKTRKAEQLFSVRGDEYLLDSMVYPLPVPGDGVYLEAYYFDREEDINTFDIYKYSFETNEIEECSSFHLKSGVDEGLTRDHFIARTARGDIRVYVYDHEGNLISESELLNDYYQNGTIIFAGEDEDYVYFEAEQGPDDLSCMLALPIEGGDFLVIR